MALTSTTVSGAITASATTLKLASATGVAVGMFAYLDSEMVVITDVSLSPTVAVQRGRYGTVATLHATGCPIAFGLPTDFVQIPNLGQSATGTQKVVTYGAAGAITIPTVNTYILLQSGASSAMTLNDPNADNQAEITIQAGDAKAYTVDNGSTNNATGSGFNGGGTPSDVATFGGAIGDNMLIKAVNGKWLVQYLRNVSLG